MQGILLRGAIIAGFLASMAGPWFFDEILVPAQYACSAPFIRLEGDFCGLPLSGFHLIIFPLAALLQIVLSGSGGSALSGIAFRDLVVMAAFLALHLPAITTALRAVRGSGQMTSLLTIAAWSIAAPIALFIALSSPRGFHLSLWGVWLYIGLAIVALIFEMTVRVKDAADMDLISA
jgi:hypothetical protein